MGSRTSSGDVAALERAEGSFDADIFCLSHTHRRYATKLPLLTLTRKGQPRVIERTKVFVRCGAFLKGFVPDEPRTDRAHFPSYAETKALRPTDLGWVAITIDLAEYSTPRGAVKRGGTSNHSLVRQTITVAY